MASISRETLRAYHSRDRGVLLKLNSGSDLLPLDDDLDGGDHSAYYIHYILDI